MRKNLKAILLSICTVLGTARAQFPDVPPDHYAETAISQLADLGIITGFPDGLFRGQKSVSRFELSLILTRMWHAWSTEQLNDIFSQLTRTELGVAQLKQQQGAFEGRLEAVDNLEQRLARSEQALGELGARTQGVGATERALGGLNAQLNGLENQVVRGSRTVAGRFQTLQKRVDSGTRQNETLTNQIETLDAQLEAQRTQLEQALTAQRQAEAEALWQGTLRAEAGVAGNAADYRLGLDVVTRDIRIGADLSPAGPEVLGEVSLTEGVTLLGRHHLGPAGSQGAMGVRFDLISGLGAGFYGGYDTGLVAGAFIGLSGDQQSALPGVLATLGALTDTSATGGFGSKLLVQVAGGVNFGDERFSLTPRAFYRRQTGGDDHQLVGGELRVSTTQDAFGAAAAVRYGVATNLLTDASVGAPEGELSLSLPSGAFARVQLTGGLPDLDNLPSFADGSPLQTEQLVLGTRVGVVLDLDELLR